MKISRVLLSAAMALLPALAACAPDAPLSPAADQTRPTSVINPATGEPVAINFQARPDRRVVDVRSVDPRRAKPMLVVEPCQETDPNCQPPCDPVYDYGCEPCPADNPDAWCYTPPPPPCPAFFHEHHTLRLGMEPYMNTEVDIVPENWSQYNSCERQVMTGIGFRVDEGDNYTTMQLASRWLEPDGTLLGNNLYRDGSVPFHTLEAWAEVPDGYGIVGVALGQGGSHDLRTMILYYRKVEMTVYGVRMTGPTLVMRAGVAPYGSIDVSYTTSNDREVYVGLGVRSAVQKTKTMVAFIGQIPLP